jgi:molybdate transport system permease protein
VAALVHTTPLLVRACREALEELNPDYERAARSFGAGPGTVLWRVVLPQIRRRLASAVVLAFGRAMGDFGITLMIAGNVAGKTQTLPVAIYAAAASGEGAKAAALAVVISVLLIALMYGAARLEPKRALR